MTKKELFFKELQTLFEKYSITIEHESLTDDETGETYADSYYFTNGIMNSLKDDVPDSIYFSIDDLI